jgi:4'-phosphopantetheinyl transferase
MFKFERPDLLTLPSREIHLSYARLHAPPMVIRSLLEVLSRDERERAARFHFDRHREAFIISRGLLRSILCLYTGVPPDKLVFIYGAKGKPSLPDSSIYFNLSHSKDVALYAVAREPLLGVDVEWIRPMSDAESIAKRFFSPAEYAEVMALDEKTRSLGFLNCWTRKEAYVKAVGDGLHVPLDEFQVSLMPGQQAIFHSINGDRERAARWSLFDVRPTEGYVGALAVYGRGWRLRHCTYTSDVLKAHADARCATL